MSKYRMLDTRFWNDNFISELDPIEKLLFCYFLTNEHTNISGVYELPLKIVAIETGIDQSMLQKILPRLSGKIDYSDGWVIAKNFLKYQNINSRDVQTGVTRELAKIPNKLSERLSDKNDTLYTPSLDGHMTTPGTKLILNLNLTKPKPNRTSNKQHATIVKQKPWGPDDHLEVK